MNHIQELAHQMQKDLSRKMDDIFIEGLMRKGYEFERPWELEDFVKNHCRCEDREHVQERTYFVKDEPFMVWRYKFPLEHNIVHQGPNTTMTVDQGTYQYL